MTIQKIIPKSEASLKPTQWVTDIHDLRIQYAIEDLKDTLADMQEKSGGLAGVGLAANQIEYPAERYGEGFVPPNIYIVSIPAVRAAKVRTDGFPCEFVPPSVYINARIIPMPGPDGEAPKIEKYMEGCLSVMGFTGPSVPRYKDIRVEAINETGEDLSVQVSGFLARIHQHEIDHGKGLEYLNQMNFSVDELRKILNWIEEIQLAGAEVESVPCSVIAEKLDCTSKAPMLSALKAWAEHTLENHLPKILIIGSSQGLGLEFVKEYRTRGYRVIATTRNSETASALKSELDPLDILLEMDVTQEDSVKEAMAQVTGPLDIVMYVSGDKGYKKTAGVKSTLWNAEFFPGHPESRSEGRAKAFEVNAFGFDRVMHALKEKLLGTPKASVVYIGTGVADPAQHTSDLYPFYAESKETGTALARSWGNVFIEQHLESSPEIPTPAHTKFVEVNTATKGLMGIPVMPYVRVFTLIPGLVNTGMGAGVDGAADPKKRVSEMADCAKYVQETGDTFGAWKYDRTKQVTYDLPNGLQKLAIPVQKKTVETSKVKNALLWAVAGGIATAAVCVLLKKNVGVCSSSSGSATL